MKVNKLAILINSMGSGGSERMVSLLLEHAANNKLDVTLVCIENEVFYRIPSEIKVHFLLKNKLPSSNIARFFLMPILAFRLSKYLLKNNINIVQSHIYLSNFINILTKILNKNHKAFVVETMDISFFNTRIVHLLLIKLLYRFADGFIFKSKLMAHNMENFLGKQLKFKVLYNAYDIDTIQTILKEPVDDFIFAEGNKYLISVGRLESQKRHELLLQTLTHLDTNVHLIIIGKGSRLTEIKELARKLNISNRLHIMDPKQNPFKYIARSDIFILSSDYEGFPNVLVEAMICRIPVVATDCPSGPREILAPETSFLDRLQDDIEITKNGILVPTNNAPCLVSAISEILKNNTLAIQLQNNAYKRALDFHKDKIAKEYFIFENT